MSISKKVKKAGEAINKSVDKLIKLVNKKAPKKKILKQVDKVQDLKKEKKQLKKDSKLDGAGKAPKAEKKTKLTKKTFAEKAAPSTTQIEEKLVKNRSTIAKSKEVKKPVKKKVAAKKVVSKNTSVDDKSGSSIEMNARAAIYKITELSTLQQLEDFLKGEKRKTVLERANARKNALKDQK